MSIDNQIIEFFKQPNYLPMKQHEIANALGIIDKNERNAFRKVLYELEKKGTIERLRKNRFSLPNLSSRAKYNINQFLQKKSYNKIGIYNSFKNEIIIHDIDLNKNISLYAPSYNSEENSYHFRKVKKKFKYSR